MDHLGIGSVGPWGVRPSGRYEFGHSLDAGGGGGVGTTGLRPANTLDERALAYAGTSFAAPVVTLFSAWDLMLVDPACGAMTASRLAAGDLDDTPLTWAVAATGPAGPSVGPAN